MDELKRVLLETLALKDLPRAGWVAKGVKSPESVASHSWGLAWLTLVLCPPNLNRGRILEMAALHDLAEVRVGDITPHDGISEEEKFQKENEAMISILEPMCHREELKSIWDEYEQSATPEAKFLKSMDKLDMALQAQRYGNLTEFIDSALKILDDELHRKLARIDN